METTAAEKRAAIIGEPANVQMNAKDVAKAIVRMTRMTRYRLLCELAKQQNNRQLRRLTTSRNEGA